MVGMASGKVLRASVASGCSTLVAECCFEFLERAKGLGEGFGPLGLRVCCHRCRDRGGSVDSAGAGCGCVGGAGNRVKD